MSQFPSHRPSNSDNVRIGNAASPDRTVLGVPFAGKPDSRFTGASLIVVNLGAPILADADGLGASQTVTGASTAFLLNGALASTVDAAGNVVLDVPRNVVGAWTNTAVITITGYDEYGQLMIENSASGTSHTGAKAFKKITSITTSATITGATVGTGSKLGLPFRPCLGGFIRGRADEDTSDAGTYVAPIRTTSTATTADVRGTYAPAATLDGTLQVSVLIAMANGPADADGFGIAQFAG